MNRGRAVVLGFTGAAVFIIPNFQSVTGISFIPSFHVQDFTYFTLLAIGTILAALAEYLSAVSE